MAKRVAKNALFDQMAAVAKALGSGRRAELVDILGNGPRAVEELAAEIEQSVANTSQHLQVLARAGLVSSRRDGNRIIYRVSSERVCDLWAAVREVAAGHVPGFADLVEDYLGPRGNIPAVTRQELLSRLEEGNVVVLDVRPRAEFDAGHIPGAVFVDPRRIQEQLEGLPADLDVVAYCRGSYCAFAAEAVRALQEQGVTARRLEDGFPEWRREGMQVERTEVQVSAPSNGRAVQAR